MEVAIASMALLAIFVAAIASICLSVVVLRVIGGERRNKGWIYAVGMLAAAATFGPAFVLGVCKGLESFNASHSVGSSAFLGGVIVTVCTVVAATVVGRVALEVIPDTPLPAAFSAKGAALWSIGAVAVTALWVYGAGTTC